MSKLGFTALIVGLGYLMFKVLVGAAMLLYYLCKMAVLLPIAIIALMARQTGPVTLNPAPILRPPTATPTPDLGPATIESTGDWRQDRETLIRLLNEGKIK